MTQFGTNSTTVWHEFLIHSPSTTLIAPSQKDSLDNQKFTRCVDIVQGFLTPGSDAGK
jgi:hypothetical protein